MKIISVENAEHYIWGVNCDGWHLAKSAALSVIQERVPPNSSEVRHLHNRAEQFFYVLSGVATLEVAGTICTVKPGQGIHILAGIAHALSNRDPLQLEFLVISTPPSHDDRVEI